MYMLYYFLLIFLSGLRSFHGISIDNMVSSQNFPTWFLRSFSYYFFDILKNKEQRLYEVYLKQIDQGEY